MKKIIVFSHIPTRDDAGDSVFVAELNGSAMAWKFSVLSHIRNAILTIKPDIVVMPEMRCEYTRDVAKQLHEWGVVVVQKRCEMGITTEFDVDEATRSAVFGNWQIGEYIDLDLVWGPKFADMVAENTNIPESKIKVVGALGFDQYFIPPPPVPLPDGKTVLFAGGFGYADRQAIYAVPEIKVGDPSHILLVSNDRNYRHHFIKLIEAFKERFPDWTVKIRPHGGEGSAAYTAALGKGTDFLANGATVAAITGVDAIIHTGSTMAFEAHLMGKPTFNYRNTSLDKLVGAIAPTFQEIDDLLDAFAVIDVSKSNADLDVVKQLEEGYYGVVDGQAHKRVAEAILALPGKETNYPDVWPKDEVKYLTKGAYVDIHQWYCSVCGNVWFGDKARDLLKCPYCGMPCINLNFANKSGGPDVQMQKVPDGVNPPPHNLQREGGV